MNRFTGSPLLNEALLFPVYVPATSMQPTITDGANFPNYAESTGASTVSPNINFLEYPAGATAKFAQFEIAAPHGWDLGRMYWSPYWSHNGASSPFAVDWRIKGVAIGDDAAISTNFSAESQVIDTGGTNDNLYFGDNEQPKFLDIAGTLLAHHLLFFNVFRVPAAAGDTMVTPARLLGVTLYFRLTTRRHT